MDHRRFGQKIAADYDRGAEQYRIDDEIEALSENHQRIGGNIRRLSRSFTRPIRVLELGCGTGRYFHWLENTKLLVGTDLSAEMLRCAKHPLQEHAVTAQEIKLMQANLYEVSFEPRSFDLIYSMGVFGYGAALTPELAARIATWLAPDGRFYFDAIEKREMGRSHALKRSVKSAVVPFLPGAMKQKLADREAAAVPVIVHTRAEMERVMDAAGFMDFTISSNTCHSPLWTGMHLECIARKQAAAVSERGEAVLGREGFDLEAAAAKRMQVA
ncbi:MAG: class I SAM-dependent methyltransferase [Verrucomicrobiota bacterium]